MAFTPEITSINQRVQIGAEATTALGTVVAAGKQLECFDWTFGINGDIVSYGATGHKYDSVQEENTEWVDLTVGGALDYNGVIYLLAGVMGSASPVAHLASVTAKDWIYTPPVVGTIVPQTYTLEQGDAVRAHRTAYSLFNSFGYTLTRKATTLSAKGISQPIVDAITLTATPTPVALAPVFGKQVNVYIDPTSGALGTTQLPKILSATYMMDGVYGPFWPMNRANIGFSSHVDLKPKATIKIKVEADAQGMALLTSLQAGTTQFIRVNATGTVIAADGPGNISNVFQHDMAVKIGKPSTLADDSGIFAIEWECLIIEDPAWGKAQTFTITNLLAAL